MSEINEPIYSQEAIELAEKLKSMKPKNISDFDLEKLFYLRKILYSLDGRLYIRVENHLEEIPDGKLESIVLYYLDDMFRLIGKRGKIKAVTDLIKLRPSKAFAQIDSAHKQIAFNNGVFNANDWSFTYTSVFDSLSEAMMPVDCSFQLNFDMFYRLCLIERSCDPTNILSQQNNQAQDNFILYDPLPIYEAETFKDAIGIYNKAVVKPVTKNDGYGRIYYEYPVHIQLFKNLISILFNTPTPTADKFFEEIAGENKDIIERIYQMIGYILVPGNEAKAFFLLQGESNSGKSVIGKFLEGYFPPGKVTSLDIKRLGSQFLPDALSSSCLNLSMDLPNGRLPAGAVAVLKMLTGDDLITQEVKFKDARPYRGTCKFAFSTNFPIVLQEPDEAFLNRLICIPFEKSIPKDKQDPDLLKKLNAERAAITAKALASYYFLRANNFRFAGSNSIKPKVEYKADPEDIIKEFAYQMCIFTYNEKDFVLTEDLFTTYLEFCRVNGYPRITSAEGFSKRFKACFPYRVESVRIGSNRNGYKKIQLRKMPVEHPTDERDLDSMIGEHGRI